MWCAVCYVRIKIACNEKQKEKKINFLVFFFLLLLYCCSVTVGLFVEILLLVLEIANQYKKRQNHTTNPTSFDADLEAYI